MTSTLSSPPDAMASEGEDVSSIYLEDIRRRLVGTTINEESLLATDYLNHFNEVIMMLELVAVDPDCLEEVRQWSPKSYPDHFRDSNFTHKDLAILAYYRAPEEYRKPFDATIAQLDRRVLDAVDEVAELIKAGQSDRLCDEVQRLSRNLQRLIDIASAIIHADQRGMGQSEIDELINS